MEKTYLMVKPDGVQRGLIGRIVTRFEDKGFKLVAAKLITVSEDQAKRHYAEHAGKDFFGAGLFHHFRSSVCNGMGRR